MKLPHQADTIVALATPTGEGGISVIRITGPDAFLVTGKGFRGKSNIVDAQTHTAHFGRLVDKDEVTLDQVVAVVFRSPNSYTGEDTAEISCHGGVLVSGKIVEAMIEYGARHAQPGEFTKRAFLNGKLDLSQAEAVADLIHARSDAAHRSSMAQLHGQLSGKVQKLRNQLIESISLLELELDFAEEGLELVDKSKVAEQVRQAIGNTDELSGSYKAGRIYREGVKVVIAGAPNAGKSSLLNALLNENRAIVTEIPGTTRDVIEEALSIGGVMFRVADTAGVRETTNAIEQEGMRRTEAQVQNCDVLLMVMDASRDLTEKDQQDLGLLMRQKTPQSAAKLVALNKIDLVPQLNGEITRRSGFVSDFPNIKVSALTGDGLGELKTLLLNLVLRGSQASSDGRVTVTNARHFDALNRARVSLGLALESLEQGRSGEFITVDLRRALDSLGEITGEVTTDEILNNIFAKFCIGK